MHSWSDLHAAHDMVRLLLHYLQEAGLEVNYGKCHIMNKLAGRQSKQAKRVFKSHEVRSGRKVTVFATNGICDIHESEYDASGVCTQKHQLSQERYNRKIISNEIKRTPRITTNEKAGEIPSETGHDWANAPTTPPN